MVSGGNIQTPEDANPSSTVAFKKEAFLGWNA